MSIKTGPWWNSKMGNELFHCVWNRIVTANQFIMIVRILGHAIKSKASPSATTMAELPRTALNRVQFMISRPFLPLFLLFATLAGQQIFAGSYSYTTLAGVSPSASLGNTDGTGEAARFNRPNRIAVDSFGNVYVTGTYDHAV